MSGKREYGDYQTPLFFAEQVCSFLKEGLHIKPSVVIEPTCGLGAFLKASRLFNPDSIYGIEVNSKYCQNCSDNINDDRVTIYNADFFNFDFRTLTKVKNPLVLGNPPWVTNSELSSMQSNNVPNKSNIKGLKGIDAMTGASNFDICEYIISKLISVFKNSNATIAMLCKTSVARNVFIEINRLNVSCEYCNLYEIDTKKIFNINASACLLVIQLAENKDCTPKACNVYDFRHPDVIKSSFGYKNGLFYSDLSVDSENFDGICCFEWRQGVKHDCSKVMELTAVKEGFMNGNKQVIDIESDIVFPLVKSSMFKKPIVDTFSKFVIVTQKKVGEATSHLQNEVPKTWAYLNGNKELLDNRKSSIYRGAPQFSMFGVGDYSYSQYKVGISGFYKEPLFSVLHSPDEKPVMTDDTSYFICFDDFDDAYVAMLYLNTKQVKNFLKNIIFKDAKRPYTKKILSRIDFNKIKLTITINNLIETEEDLMLEKRITPSMVEKFSKLPAFSGVLSGI